MVPFAAFVDHLRNGYFRRYLAQNSLIQSLLRGTHWCCLLAMAMKLYQVEEEEAWMSWVELNSHNLLYCFVLVYRLPADIPTCLDWVLIDRALVLNLTRIIICAYLHPAIDRAYSLTHSLAHRWSMDGWMDRKKNVHTAEWNEVIDFLDLAKRLSTLSFRIRRTQRMFVGWINYWPRFKAAAAAAEEIYNSFNTHTTTLYASYQLNKYEFTHFFWCYIPLKLKIGKSSLG